MTAAIDEKVGIGDASLSAFYRGMSTPERRTFWACAAGWCLDGMDFMIYPLVIGTIAACAGELVTAAAFTLNVTSVPVPSIASSFP